MTRDWRIYEMLTKKNWRPGDEPPIKRQIIIRYPRRPCEGGEWCEIVVPLPEQAHAKVESVRG